MNKLLEYFKKDLEKIFAVMKEIPEGEEKKELIEVEYEFKNDLLAFFSIFSGSFVEFKTSEKSSDS